MATAELHVGDQGVTLRVTLSDPVTSRPVDVSSATTLRLTLSRPDGTAFAVAGFLTTDGKDGKISYLTQASDLDQAGTWRVQAYVATPAWAEHSDVGKFKVRPNLG